jgi:hypothetical protein
MNCGHRGKPSRNEERMLDMLIRESKFMEDYNVPHEEPMMTDEEDMIAED